MSSQSHATAPRRLMRWLKLRLDGVRRPFDCLSKVIKVRTAWHVTGCWPSSRSHAELFIYLGLSASKSSSSNGRSVIEWESNAGRFPVERKWNRTGSHHITIQQQNTLVDWPCCGRVRSDWCSDVAESCHNSPARLPPVSCRSWRRTTKICRTSPHPRPHRSYNDLQQFSTPLSLSLSLSVSTAILQVNPGQPVFIEAKHDGIGGGQLEL